MIVYKIENLINGKIYVGRTVKKLNVRMSQHKNTTKTLIGRAIQKYGWENFRAEIIEECSSFEELVEREVYWIKKLNSKVPNGYNIIDCSSNGSLPKVTSIPAKSIFEDKESYLYKILYVIRMIKGKWKLPILLNLFEIKNTSLRYSELKRRIPKIPCIMLTKTMRELERNRLVRRIVIKENPPKIIEYSLTEWGLSLIQALNAVRNWSLKHMEKIESDNAPLKN